MSDAPKVKILVVDDDVKLLRDIKVYLQKQGYEVESAKDASAGLALAESMLPDLVVLDISFPESISGIRSGIDGIEVLRRLREEGGVPVLMLSASNITAVKVMTLTIGADDYLQKPFDMSELGARIEAILRRTRPEVGGEKVLNLHRLRLDPGERRVWKDGVLINLTGVEFDLLYTLARRPDHVYSREKLLDQAWKGSSYSVPKVVDVHIGHIRKKIEDDPAHPTLIETVRGTGYRLADVSA